VRLLKVWVRGTPYHHTPLDDLESFLWLLVWCILCIIEEKGTLDEDEAEYLQCLQSPDARSFPESKTSILSGMHKSVRDLVASEMVTRFYPLLSKWYEISFNATGVVSILEKNWGSQSDDDFRNTTYEYFEKFLDIGLSHVANLPDTWDEIFASIQFVCVICGFCSRPVPRSTIMPLCR
jgi:hypothetical protein